jgi:hypothetical protein
MALTSLHARSLWCCWREARRRPSSARARLLSVAATGAGALPREDFFERVGGNNQQEPAEAPARTAIASGASTLEPYLCFSTNPTRRCSDTTPKRSQRRSQ